MSPAAPRPPPPPAAGAWCNSNPAGPKPPPHSRSRGSPAPPSVHPSNELFQRAPLDPKKSGRLGHGAPPAAPVVCGARRKTLQTNKKTYGKQKRTNPGRKSGARHRRITRHRRRHRPASGGRRRRRRHHLRQGRRAGGWNCQTYSTARPESRRHPGGRRQPPGRDRRR